MTKALGLVLASGLFVAATSALAAQLPDIGEPDFARAQLVAGSMERMAQALDAVPEGPDKWRALRAAVQCRDTMRRVRGYQSSAAYDAEVGEQQWRLCHNAYQRVRTE